MLRILKDGDYKTSDWAGGKTTELVVWPVDGNYGERNFDWRLSSATVELEESDFSDLSGFGRFISVLEGQLELSHEDGAKHEVKGQKVYGFDGGRKTHSVGKAKDFNLIFRNGLNCQMGRKEIEEGQTIQLEIPICGYLAVFIAGGEVDATFGGSDYFSIRMNSLILADKLDDEEEMNIYAKMKSDLIICTIGE